MTHQQNTRPRRLFSALVALATAAGLSAFGAAPAARAAAPDVFGFVLFDGVSTVATGTFPPATAVASGVPGRYRILFPGLAARGGVVHITAINPSPHWCQADGWAPSGADEIVAVSCYRPGGVLDPSPFTAIFESSSATVIPAALGRFGYVDAAPSGAVVSQYNSAGAVNSVSHVAVGQWIVRLPGLTTPGSLDGSLQATAVSPNVGARCKIARWASLPGGQQALVYCFDGTGAPFDTRFTMSYQYQRSLYAAAIPPKYFGYLWNAPPLGPVSTNFDSVTGPGTGTLLPAGVGLSLVTFPGLVARPDTVQVTAFGTTPDFCGLLTTWFHIGANTVIRDVNCFTNTGVPNNAGFFVSANAAF